MDQPERVAIVGIGGCFSGSPTLDRCWANNRGGVDHARDVPASRWPLSPEDVYRPGEPTPDHVYSRRGCLIDDLARDCADVGLDRASLDGLDPLFLLTLHAGRHAFFDGVTDGLDRRR